MAALDAARAAGAATYAADQLTAAATALGRYDQFVAERDYKQALSAAIEARDLAFEAGRAAQSRQRALSDDVTRLVALLDAGIRAADADLKTRGRVPARQQAALKKSRASASLALQEARAAATRGEFTAAIERLTAASAELTTVRDKATATARKAR